MPNTLHVMWCSVCEEEISAQGTSSDLFDAEKKHVEENHA